MFTFVELLKVLESSGRTFCFLLVCLFAVIIEKKLNNGGNFEVLCVNLGRKHREAVNF